MDDIALLDRSFTRNPLGLLRQLQRERPVTQMSMADGTRVWLVSRYREARTLLSDPRLSKNRVHARLLLSENETQDFDFVDNMLHKDPPDHTRLRKLVMKAFTPRAVIEMRSRITDIADELLDAMQERSESGPVDLVGEYAMPLPIRVISELVGVPDHHADEFMSLVVPLFDTATPDVKKVATDRATALLTNIIGQKRRRPCDDLLSALIEATYDGDRLSEEELMSMTFLLIGAGYDTTAHLISNAVVGLIRNPQQLKALRENRSMLPQAVEEFLRFDGPINVATVRFTAQPVRVGPTKIPANEIVLISLLAANHDPRKFTEPDRLDISRDAGTHLGFGHGIHYCVGAPLARLEAHIAIDRLLSRFDELAIDEDVELEYRDSTLVHGLDALSLHLRVASA